MATRRRTTTSRTASARRSQASRAKRKTSSPSLSLGISPAVVRSLIGIVLLVLGAVTLIALMLPGQGALTDWWRNLAVPYFGDRALAAAVRAAAVGLVPRVGPGQGSRRAVGPHAAGHRHGLRRRASA